MSNIITYQTKIIHNRGHRYLIAEEALNELISTFVKPPAELLHIDKAIIYYCSKEEMKLKNDELVKLIFD